MSGENLPKLLNKQGQGYLEGLRQTVRELWQKCGEQDGIPPEAKLVVFSDDNRYLPFYNQAQRMLNEAERESTAGGYVGLKIEKRRR